MKNKITNIITLITIAITLFAVSGLAQTARQQASNRQVETILNGIASGTNTFKLEIQRNNNQYPTRQNDRLGRIDDMIRDFETSTATFRARFNSRQAVGDDFSAMLNNATLINSFMVQNEQSARAQTAWTSLKSDLNTFAGYYGVSWNWYQTVADNNRPYTGTDAQLRNLIAQIESKTAQYKRAMGSSLNNSTVNNTNVEDSINAYIARFEEATDRLGDRFDSRDSTVADASEVLNRGRNIDKFMGRSRMSINAQRNWVSLKTDLDTLAKYYNVSWNWNQPLETPPVYTSTDAQLRNLITQIELKTNNYKRVMDRSLDRSSIDNTNAEDSINAYISRFENATNDLKERFNSRRSTTADASEVLNRGLYINQFMAKNLMSRQATRQWESLRTDLNTLATYYRVSWNWNQQTPNNSDSRLTGTYRLNASRSDNVANVVNISLGNNRNDQNNNVRRNLERRLTSPEMIAVDKNNQRVSMSSTNSPQVTFEADGIARTETNDRGRSVTTTATLIDNTISINYDGDRINDFYVTFESAANGQLNVTRRIYLENSNKTITVSSVYDKVDNAAQWSKVNTGPVDENTTGDFYIPNGTQILASLEGTVNTKTSQVGDRFEMSVTSPGQYRGAVIGGRVAQAADSGRFSGRANITLEFDTITINGRNYRFAGIIDGVSAANGDTITVNNEGTVRDSSQTTQTATRTGIGAVLGAIIGAIAGGGKGAAIGAGVGAGAGAGSVLITGRDSIELGPGSAFNITATAPANADINR